MMVLLTKLCSGGPRGLPAPTHDDATAPDDSGPRNLALSIFLIVGGVIAGIIVIVGIIICCRSRRSSDL